MLPYETKKLVTLGQITDVTASTGAFCRCGPPAGVLNRDYPAAAARALTVTTRAVSISMKRTFCSPFLLL